MSTPTITRRRAWARLLILMTTRELPDPDSIEFFSTGVRVAVADMAAFEAWRAAVEVPNLDRPIASTDGQRIIHDAWGSWYGWHVTVHAAVPVPAALPPVDDDLSAVRALADEDLAPGGEVAASAGVTGAATVPDAEMLAVLDRHVGASPDRLVQPAPVQDPALRGDA